MNELEAGTFEYYSQTFNGLDLSASSHRELEFEDCTFVKCDFSEAKFGKCKFIDCRFVDCNLNNLSVAHSKFMEVSFEGCKIVGVDWSKADWPSIASFGAVKFESCLISYSSFYGLELQEISIVHCKALEVDFREGNFTESDFSYTNFSGSLFSKTRLRSVNFAEATNYHIDVLNNDIKDAKFSRYEAVSLLECLGIELLD